MASRNYRRSVFAIARRISNGITHSFSLCWRSRRAGDRYILGPAAFLRMVPPDAWIPLHVAPTWSRAKYCEGLHSLVLRSLLDVMVFVWNFGLAHVRILGRAVIRIQ